VRAQEEAEFFYLARLSALCEEEIQRIEEAKEVMWRKNIEILKEEIKKFLGEAILARCLPFLSCLCLAIQGFDLVCCSRI
jgi:hypothetical protein